MWVRCTIRIAVKPCSAHFRSKSIFSSTFVSNLDSLFGSESSVGCLSSPPRPFRIFLPHNSQRLLPLRKTQHPNHRYEIINDRERRAEHGIVRGAMKLASCHGLPRFVFLPSIPEAEREDYPHLRT